MPREDDDLMATDRAFDAMIETIRARDGTPAPEPLFSRNLESHLLRQEVRDRRTAMHTPSTTPDHPSMWPTRRVGRGAQWAAVAATVALLLAIYGEGYLSGVSLPGRDEPATNIAAPVTGSSERVAFATPAGSPMALDRRIGRCDARKTYMSSPGGYVFLQNPSLFSDDLVPIEQLQLQHWSFGVGLGRTFPATEWDGINGLVMDTVTNGIYRATFSGPVVVSTWYGGQGGWVPTEMTGATNTVDLGVGESVLFEAGTPHEIENPSVLRGVGVERLILFSGDGTALLPALKPVDRPSEAIVSIDSNQNEGVTVRLDGTGIVPPDAAPPGWDNAIITTEFVTSLDDPLTTLVPPCEDPDYQQVRDVDGMFNSRPPVAGVPAANQYIGYLVWIGEGGRG